MFFKNFFSFLSIISVLIKGEYADEDQTIEEKPKKLLS